MPVLSAKKNPDLRSGFGTCFEKYESSRARKVKGVLPEAIEAIDRLKPYKDGNDALWRISQLENTQLTDSGDATVAKNATISKSAVSLFAETDWNSQNSTVGFSLSLREHSEVLSQ